MRKIINSYIEFQWWLLAYTVGTFMLVAAQAVSLLIPPLKVIVKDYERTCSFRAMFFIGLVSFIPFTMVFIIQEVLIVHSGYDLDLDIVFYVIMFFVWIPAGFLILSLLHDYKYKKKGL